MYHEKKRWARRRKLLLAVVLGAALLVLVVLGHGLWKSIGANLNAQAAEALKQTIVQGAVQCYAVEGAYPESVSYLEHSYGIRVDHTRFLVEYRIFAENQLPEVTVIYRGGDGA